MLPGLNPFDPAGYEILMVSDGTLVCPLSTDKARVCLTLSGILLQAM